MDLAVESKSRGGVLAILWAERAIIVGVLSVVVFFTVGAVWVKDLSNPLKYAAIFLWLFGVMMWLAFRAVNHADALACAICHAPKGCFSFATRICTATFRHCVLRKLL